MQNIDLFPQNTWHDFDVELTKELVFNNKCECALLFFDVNPLFQLELNIFCDILEQTCFENSLASFLSPVTELPYKPTNPLFFPIKTSTIKRLRISIKNSFRLSNRISSR